jgi:DeoR/GlpR family transcriptional regulator of sugar metabolism
MTERHNRILELLARKQRLEVSVLAEVLAVSQVTIRKDLDYLEERELIRREHGYALFGSLDDVGSRMAFHYNEKRRIAKLAASLVEEEETIMIESGSCCALLAEELANTKPVTIVTNSAFIANHIRHAPYARVILLGGEYQNSAQVLVGSITRQCAEIFLSNKFFMGTDGFNEHYGFTGKNHLRAQTVREMAEHAEQIIVLTESEKFLHQGSEGTVRTQDVSRVYTDERIPKEKEVFLMEHSVAVFKVPEESSQEQGFEELPLILWT